MYPPEDSGGIQLPNRLHSGRVASSSSIIPLSCEDTTANEEPIPRDVQDEPENAQEEQSPSKRNLACLTFGLCLCTLVVSLDITILATATPNITTNFHSLDDVGWYGSAYLLLQTAMQPTFGRLYNSFDIKWTFLSGLMIFEVGSVLCAAATSSTMLIVGRAVSGVGAAAIFSGGMNIISIVIPLKRRAPYIAMMSVMLGVSSIAGPPLGGFLTDRLGWRWCFWINIPCGGVAFVIILLSLQQNVRHAKSHMTLRQRLADMDPLGAIFLLCGGVAFLIGIQWGGAKYPWSNARVWGNLLASGLCITLFGVIQWKLGDKASIPARIFFQRTILSSSLFSAFLSMAFYVHMFYLPIYYQAVMGATAESSGLHVIPYQISNTIASLVAGLTVGVVGWYVPFIWIGSIAFVVGSGLLYTISVNTNQTTLIGYQILTGTGFGASVQLPYIVAQAVSSRDDMSSANAIMIFFHSIGGTISLGIAQTLFLINLHHFLSVYAPSVDAAVIIAAGPTDLSHVTTSDQLPNILQAYSMAITYTFILSIATGALAFLSSLWLEWKDIRGINVLTGL